MFKFLLLNFTKFYFILIIYISIFYHTVHTASVPVLSNQNEPLSKENKTEHVKRGEKIQENMKVGNQSIITSATDDRFVPAAKNVTANNPLPVEDILNSTAVLPPWMKDGALQRTGYVVLGIMSIVVFFFVIRAVRLRHKKSKSRKYGVITSTVSDMEMEPLDKDDDEEEDTTLFDAQHKYSLQ